MVGWIKMKLGAQIGLGPGHIVLDGDPAPPPQRAHPQFLAHICYRKMTGWIKMSLGREVGLGPKGHCVTWGPSSPPRKTVQSTPIFGPCLLWPNGWMDQDATWYGGSHDLGIFTWTLTHQWRRIFPEPCPAASAYCVRSAAFVDQSHSRLCNRWWCPWHWHASITAMRRWSAWQAINSTDCSLWWMLLHGSFVQHGNVTTSQFSAHVYCSQMAGWSRCHLVWR